MPKRRGLCARARQLDQQLRDLDGVERSTLAQVVARHEQGQASSVGNTRVDADPPDQRDVACRRRPAASGVDQLDARRLRQDLARLIGAQRLVELRVDRERVPVNTGTRTQVP